jgi:probable phosphoglycerate mutase
VAFAVRRSVVRCNAADYLGRVTDTHASSRPIGDPDRRPSTVPAPIDPMAYYFQDILLLNNRQAVRLYLIRHGESGGNEARREGRIADFDPPLTETGREQARRLGERMAAYGVDAVYASPLRRAYDTGHEIAHRLGLEITVLDDLQEINEPLRARGEFTDANVIPEGVTHQEIKRQFEEDPTWDNLPGSEKSAPFRERICRAVDTIVRDNPGRKVAVACHGGVIQSYVACVLGLKTDFPFYAFNASITSIRAAGERRAIWRLNDLAHLEGTRMT